MKLSFEDILDTLRDKYGDGFYKFKIDRKSGRLIGCTVEDPPRNEEDLKIMDEIRRSVLKFPTQK